MQSQPKKKSVAIWIVLLVLPFALLALTAMLQFAVQFALSSSVTDTSMELQNGEFTADFPEEDTAVRVINVATAIIGMGSVLMIIVGTPIWVTLLVIAVNHNKQLAAQRPKHPHA